MDKKPPITTICGSMRYYNQMLALANECTLEGHIVLMPFVLKTDDPYVDESLQELHRAKIDMSDNVFVFIETKGESTVQELKYAFEQGKEVFVYDKFPTLGNQDEWIEYGDQGADEE